MFLIHLHAENVYPALYYTVLLFAVHSIQVALYDTRLCYIVVRNLGLHSVAHLRGSADARL